MPDYLLESVLSRVSGNAVTIWEFAICLAASLVLGCVIALIHTYKNISSRNFIVTLVLIPVIVQSVIMVVNGNLGTGVAVAGAFSLIRFRSLPGTSREIASIFLACVAGLAAGMGYIGMAAVLTAVVGLATLVMASLPLGTEEDRRDLRVTIPENLDYAGIFDDIFRKYTHGAKLTRVKTVNMGSLYELRYQVDLRRGISEKAMLDELRVRNGNLTIVCGRTADKSDAL